MKSRPIPLFFLLLLFLSFKTGEGTRPYSFPALKYFPTMPQSAANPVTVEGAELGRHLFYDSILSQDRSMSCASCHKQEFAFSDAPNQFTKGRAGVLMKRNTMPLFNLAWYSGLFWDGRAASIEEQVFHPVRDKTEMNLLWKDAVSRVRESGVYRKKFAAAFGSQKVDSALVAKAIGQFLRTLLSYRSKYDKVLKDQARFTQDEHDGLVFANDQTKGDCLHCHPTDADALGTTGLFSNNGLDLAVKPEDYADKGRGGVTGKLADMGKFKIPSLRNVALTAPYMHDGRFKTLEEVLDFYSEGVHAGVNIDSKMQYAHQKGVKLTAEEKHKVIAFLKTLTDSAFISDPAFANPF